MSQIVAAGRNYGMAAALHDLTLRAVNRAVFCELLKAMTVRLSDIRDVSLFDAAGLLGRFVPRREWPDLARNPENQLSAEFLDGAAYRGDRCYAVYDGGRLAAYGWYAERKTPFDEHFDVLFNGAWTYMYNGFTLPGYRGRRLHAVGMCGALRAVAEEGRQGLVSCVASTNFASLQSVFRMGFRIAGTVALIRIGSHKYSFASRGCADVGFQAAPVLIPARCEAAGAT